MRLFRRVPAAIVVLFVLLCSFALMEGTSVISFRRMYSSFLDYSQVRYSQAIRYQLSTALVSTRSAAFALEGSDKFAEIFQSGDRAEMLNYLSPFCEEFNISYVNVVDANGDIVIRSYMPDDYRHDSIAYQSGVRNALNGERYSCFEKASIVKASARSTAPIRKDGKVIGAVVAVFRFDTNEWADELKERYGIEASIFSEEDGCIATTMQVNGKRGIGEPMNEEAKTATYEHKRQFSEHAVLFGTLYESLYIPIQNPEGGTFVVLCISIHSSELAHQTNVFTLTCTIAAVVALAITAFVLMRQTYSLTSSKKQLAKALEAANRANAAKSEFLARMSHEIRTPLNAVIGMTELILREDIPERARKNADVAKQAGKSLLGIINDILDISKIESGKMELVCEDYSVSRVISDVVSIAKVRAGDKPIRVRTEISPEFPAVLFGDETRVRQILMNLMGNAVKYTNEGTITLRASFVFDGYGAGGNGYAIFAVADTGIGVRDEDAKKLFAAFSQVDAKTNRKVEGTGLGLAITKTLAELMRGGVSVESEYGRGSVFTVRIMQRVNVYKPIGNITAISAGTVAAGPKPASFRAPEARILVVDDVAANLLVAEGLLEPYGAQIDTAGSGADAIALVEENDYDFVLMDHMMPGMDGVEAVRLIRLIGGGKYEKLPIIALTANAVNGMREMFLNSGFDGFLTKPVEIGELNGVMEKWTPEEKREYTLDAAAGGELGTAFVIEGVDTEVGLARCGGRVSVYRRVLKSFAEDLRKQSDAIRNAEIREGDDLKDLTARLHAIKGSAGNVGAGELYELAKTLETAAKDGDGEFLKVRLPALTALCGVITAGLEGL